MAMRDPALIAAIKRPALPPPGQPHAVSIPGSEKPGHTGIFRHWHVKDGPLVETVDHKVRTMHDAFTNSTKLYPDNNMLGWREQDAKTGQWSPYKWLDYKTVGKRRADLGAGLVHLHEKIGVTGKYPVGLWAQNRPEWQISDLAAMSQGLFTVSIYDTLGASAAEFIINHAEIVCCIASLAHVPTILSVKEHCPTLKIIISMDPLATPGEPDSISKKSLLSAWALEKGVQLFSMTDVEALGQQHPRPFNPPLPSDSITINYTSGTTGDPKGVVLTHANCVAACSMAFVGPLAAGPTDRFISYLPLAHIYARVAENTAMWGGASIGFFHGNMAEVVDDIRALKPTSFISVPRMYNRIANALKEQTIEQPGFKGALSRHIVNTKMENMKNGGDNKHILYDRIWSNKVRAAIGFGECRGMVSGAAPISPVILKFLRAAFGNQIIEGYGLTESYAVALAQLRGDMNAGTVGPPVQAAEVRLRSVPDMGYNVTDSPGPRGELCIRGHVVFKEYFKADHLTKDAFDEDGFFCTGDICSIDKLGRLSIIDRVKNLLKLAQGEYVSPEKIENVYLANMPLFSQGLVHGDGVQTFLVGVFGVDPIHFAAFASGVLGRKIEVGEVEGVLNDERVRASVLREMDSVAKKAKMAGFEKVKAVHLCVEPFTIENDLLTPTLKMKRPPAVKAFRDVFDRLNSEVIAKEEAEKAIRKLKNGKVRSKL